MMRISTAKSVLLKNKIEYFTNIILVLFKNNNNNTLLIVSLFKWRGALFYMDILFSFDIKF